MFIVLLGAPGSGKGTAGKIIAEDLKLAHISTGDLFRENLKNETELGKEAKQYIDQYLELYSGIKQFMTDVVEKAKETGYVETQFNRRRYIPELKSSNYMVRQFGQRVAMNTPIQGTAADIMKIAMKDVLKELKIRNMKTKIVLQVHDEMLLEATLDEVDEVKNLMQKCMESACKLNVPLIAEVSEATNWYDCK